jgi:hypothetical protein
VCAIGDTRRESYPCPQRAVAAAVHTHDDSVHGTIGTGVETETEIAMECTIAVSEEVECVQVDASKKKQTKKKKEMELGSAAHRRICWVWPMDYRASRNAPAAWMSMDTNATCWSHTLNNPKNNGQKNNQQKKNARTKMDVCCFCVVSTS